MYRSTEGKIIFPMITLTSQEVPIMTANKYVIIDPCIPILPTLTQAEVEALVPSEPLIFLTAATNSGFQTAKVIFPPEQGQHGFWQGSSILEYQSMLSESYYLKATINAEKRKNLPLNIYLSKVKVNDGYTTEQLSAEQLSSLIPDTVQNVNIYVKGDIETSIDFSQLTDNQKQACSFNIVGERSYQQSLSLLSTSNVKDMSVSNCILHTTTDELVFGPSVAVIKDCLFTQAAAAGLSFTENKDIKLIMTWNDFKDFGSKKIKKNEIFEKIKILFI